MDDLDSAESKFTNFLDYFEKLYDIKYHNLQSVPQLLSDREILGPKCKKKILKPLEIISERNVIVKKHAQIACQLGHAPKSTFIMVFSPDGKLAASIHGDHNIYVTNLKTGSCLHTLKGHPRTPWCIEFHPSSNDLIASGCLGGEVRVWDLKGSSEVWVSPKGNQIASLSFHPTDSVLAIATDNDIFFWNWTLKDPFTSIATKFESEKVKYVKFDPRGHKLITGIANIRTEGCTAPLSWRHPSLWPNDLGSNFDMSVPYYSASEMRPRLFQGGGQSLLNRDALASDSANSDESLRIEEPSRASEGSSSSSSSSLDSSELDPVSAQRFNEWSARLSLLWTSRRNQSAGHESDNTNSGDNNENSEPGNSTRRGGASTNRRPPTFAPPLEMDDNARPAGGFFRNRSAAAAASGEPAASGSGGAGCRNPYRVSSRLARQTRPTGFHPPPLVGVRRNLSNFNLHNALDMLDEDPPASAAGSTTSSTAPTSQSVTTARDRPTNALDPLHSISLLSSHIENMQRICGSLDLARQVDPSMRNEHREITRLGQIRSMLIEIQNEIQSLRSAVDQTNDTRNEIDRMQSGRSSTDQSIYSHHNYCTRPEDATHRMRQLVVPPLVPTSPGPSTTRPPAAGVGGARSARSEFPPDTGSRRSRSRALDNALRTIRRRRFEREDSRAMRQLVDLEMQSLVSSGEFRQHRLDFNHRRAELRAREYARFPEFFGDRNVPSGNISENDDPDSFNMLGAASFATPRPRTFSLNNDSAHVPPLNRSAPDQRPNRLLEWSRFARFRRMRNNRRTERPVTSLSSRISRMIDQQDATFRPIETTHAPLSDVNSGLNVILPGPSSGRRSRHAEELARLRSFRLVMTRLLQFVNELGSEVANSRLLDAPPLDDNRGPPSDIELEALSFRGSFREAYRLTLRSLILRIHNFIDNYLSEHGYDTIPTLEDLEENVHYLQGNLDADPGSSDTSDRNGNEHARNLRLLVRLALLLIRQLITFISAQHILNEERPISRLPNPFRDEESSASSRPIVNEPEGQTLSNLLELVELTTDNILCDVMRRSNPTSAAGGALAGEGSQCTSTQSTTQASTPSTSTTGCQFLLAQFRRLQAPSSQSTTETHATSSQSASNPLAGIQSTSNTLPASQSTATTLTASQSSSNPLAGTLSTSYTLTSSQSTSNPLASNTNAMICQSIANALALPQFSSNPLTASQSTSSNPLTASSSLLPSSHQSSSPAAAASDANSHRLTSVPRAQRLYCRRLTRPRARTRASAGLSRSCFREPPRSFFTEPPCPQAVRGGAGVVPEIVLNDAVDVNSNYLGGASLPNLFGGPPTAHRGAGDMPLRTFGGTPLRLLGRQNAVDRRSPDRDDASGGGPPDLGLSGGLASGRPAGLSSGVSRHAAIFANRQSRQAPDQFMFYRRSNIGSLASWRHIAGGHNSFDAPHRPSFNNPVANSVANSSSNIVSHRLQVWDFDINNLPDLTDRKKNVILRRCKIHFDASVEVSADGTMLIALIPKAIEFNSVVVCSLRDRNLGEVLFCHSVDANSICVSLSPTMTHLIIGVGSANNRIGILQNYKQVVAYIYRLNDKKGLRLQRGIELRTDHRLISLNCIKWLPFAGTGFIYGTNRGQLTILR